MPTRASRGLEEFFDHIRGQSGLTILDLGGATQQNVSFITNLGHRLYSEDFLQILDETFGDEDTADQSNPGRIDYFLRQALDYPGATISTACCSGTCWSIWRRLCWPRWWSGCARSCGRKLPAGLLPLRRQAGNGPLLHVPHPGVERAASGPTRRAPAVAALQ